MVEDTPFSTYVYQFLTHVYTLVSPSPRVSLSPRLDLSGHLAHVPSTRTVSFNHPLYNSPNPLLHVRDLVLGDDLDVPVDDF